MKKILIVFIIIIVIVAGFASWQFLLRPKTILFLCVHNTFRSQIAEAYFNKFAKEKGIKWQAKSAGFLEAEKINEKAIILMREEGIDISGAKPKLITEKMKNKADKIIVVCQECSLESKEKFCPVFESDKDVEYWQLPNPAEMELEEAREIRNLVKERVIDLIERLPK